MLHRNKSRLSSAVSRKHLPADPQFHVLFSVRDFEDLSEASTNLTPHSASCDIAIHSTAFFSIQTDIGVNANSLLCAEGL